MRGQIIFGIEYLHEYICDVYKPLVAAICSHSSAGRVVWTTRTVVDITGTRAARQREDCVIVGRGKTVNSAINVIL